MEKISVIPEESVHCEMPKKGQTFFYRRKSLDDTIPNMQELYTGGTVRIDNGGFWGTKKAIEQLCKDPILFYRLDVADTHNIPEKLPKNAVVNREKAKKFLDRQNADNPNYQAAKKANAAIVNQARKQHKLKRYKRAGTPKVPTVSKKEMRPKVIPINGKVSGL